jgi:hypothetical protein
VPLKIRSIETSDFEQIRAIHEKHYREEFSLPDFINKFICAYVVENSKDKIISVAGVRTIVECIAITNKDASVRERRDALLQILEASKYFAAANGYSELHAFIQEEAWKHHLEKFGFHKTKGKALVLEV